MTDTKHSKTKRIALTLLGYAVQLFGWLGMGWSVLGIMLVQTFDSTNADLWVFVGCIPVFVFLIAIGAVVSEKYGENNRKMKIWQETVRVFLAFMAVFLFSWGWNAQGLERVVCLASSVLFAGVFGWYWWGLRHDN